MEPVRSGLRTLVIAVFGLLLLGVQACGARGGESGAGQSTSTVRYGFGIAVQPPGVSPLYALPQGLNYWKDSGLNVEWKGFQGGSPAIQALIAGQVDVIMSSPLTMVTSVAKGADLVAVATFNNTNDQLPYVLPESPAQTPSDLAGKKIGVTSLESETVPMVKALMKSVGVDPDSVTFIATGGVATEVERFVRSGQVDAVVSNINLRQELEARGTNLRRVSTSQFDQIGWQSNLMMTRKYFESNRDTVQKFVTGLVRSHIFADENPEAAVRIFFEQYPDALPVGQTVEQALPQAVRQVKARTSQFKSYNGLFVNADPVAIQYYLDLMADTGALPKRIEESQVWDGSLVEPVNANVDEQAVRADARGWRP